MSLLQRLADSLRHRVCHTLQRRQVASLARDLGIRNATATSLEMLQTLASIKASLQRPVDILVDVGAHKGAFAVPAIQALQARKAVCFEPNTSLHPGLRSALSGFDAEIRGCALSSGSGSATLHVHSDPEMSSLLESDEKVLSREFSNDDASQTEDVRVPVSTLDAELERILTDDLNCFLKVDTQGSELDVLRGAQGSLARCEGVLLEHMFTTPYLEQAEFADVVLFMQSAGFRCAGALHIFRRESWRISGVDFLFVRR